MYDASFGLRKRPLAGLGDTGKPYHMYHAPGQNYYYTGGDWYGYDDLGQDLVEEGAVAPVPPAQEGVDTKKARTRAIALSTIRGGTAVLAISGLLYAHRKKEIDWYCSTLASLVLGGMISGAVSGITAAVWNAADPV